MIKIIILWIITIISLSWLTLTSTWYINKSLYISSMSYDDTIIEQKAGYNFIITNISVFSDCQLTLLCADWSIHYELQDWTSSWNILKKTWFYINQDNTIDIIKDNDILITWLIQFDNVSPEAWLYINITWYYNPDTDNFFDKNINQILNKNFENFLILIILYYFSFVFFIKIAKDWFKIWKNIILKRKNKYEND